MRKVPVLEQTITDGVQCIATQLLYAAREFTRPCGGWVRETAHRHDKIDGPVQSSGLRFRDHGSAQNEHQSLMYMRNSANDVQHNNQMVALTSLAFSDGHGCHIYPDNFQRAMALFAARKVIPRQWWNSSLEYCAPELEVEGSSLFKRFVSDATVLTMLHPKNNCTAVRGLDFKGNKIDIQNNMFWLSPKTVNGMADAHHCSSVYADVRNFGNVSRMHVEALTPELVPWLSKEAETLIQLAHSLFVTSLDQRERYHQMHPELHLNAWNAGWFQLKTMWKDLYRDHYNMINAARKDLEHKLMPEVYELGFLRTYEGMGMQTHEALELARKHSEGEPLPSDIKTDDFDDCSVCGGAGCAFCHGVGSREEFLYTTIIGKER